MKMKMKEFKADVIYHTPVYNTVYNTTATVNL